MQRNEQRPNQTSDGNQTHQRGGFMSIKFLPPDPVNNPSHYTDGKIEVIDFIEDKGLNFHRGNVIKYVARAGKKGNELEDLKKAMWYLEREINRLEQI
jgi:hypothetical protein